MLIDNAVSLEIKEKLGRVELAGIFNYPIKSCGGQFLEEAEITEFGIKDDRRAMIVDSGGSFITQREIPQLSQIRPSILGDVLTLSALGEPSSVDIPLTREGINTQVRIWKDRVMAIDQGKDASDWLTGFLRKNGNRRYQTETFRLVTMAEGVRRSFNQLYIQDSAMSVNFADGFPFLIVSEESLEELNSRLADKLPMGRFRPNIVLKSPGSKIPHYEDYIKAVQIGGVAFDLVKPCARCPIPNTDPDTSVRTGEPLRTLITYRWFQNKAGEFGAMFGQNAVHRNLGSINLKDPVQILEFN